MYRVSPALTTSCRVCIVSSIGVSSSNRWPVVDGNRVGQTCINKVTITMGYPTLQDVNVIQLQAIKRMPNGLEDVLRGFNSQDARNYERQSCRRSPFGSSPADW